MEQRSAKPFPFIPVIIGLFALGFVFSKISHILIPFILSFALAYVVNPMITHFQSRGVRREISVVCLYVLIGLVTWLLASTIVDIVTTQFQDLQTQAPQYFARGKGFVLDLEAKLNARLPAGMRVPRHVDVRYGDVLAKAEAIPHYLIGLVPMLTMVILVPFITFFLLVDGQDGIERAIQRCPSRYVEQALHLLNDIDASLGAYLRGLIVVAFAIFAASFIGLLILGVDQALAIAALSGISSFVPYFGAIVGAVVGGLVASFQFGTLIAGLKVVALFTGIRLADEMLLQPLVAKHSVHLHPLVFLFCFMLGGELFGFLGLVFAVPVACIVKALISVAWSWYASEAQLEVPHTHDFAAIPYT